MPVCGESSAGETAPPAKTERRTRMTVFLSYVAEAAIFVKRLYVRDKIERKDILQLFLRFRIAANNCL
jgi:hypothetical protein